MTKLESDSKATEPDSSTGGTWGFGLFIGVLVVTLVFFWWLLIYSHGVVSDHG